MCLQGCLREGQVHRYPDPSAAATTRYGLAPDPWQAPHTAPCSVLRPSAVQWRAGSSFAAAVSEG